MRALMLEDGRIQLADVPTPDRPGECLVRVKVAGICGTDLELVKGYAGFSGIPGHEFVGVVERRVASPTTAPGSASASSATSTSAAAPAVRAATASRSTARTAGPRHPGSATARSPST